MSVKDIVMLAPTVQARVEAVEARRHGSTEKLSVLDSGWGRRPHGSVAQM